MNCEDRFDTLLRDHQRMSQRIEKIEDYLRAQSANFNKFTSVLALRELLYDVPSSEERDALQQQLYGKRCELERQIKLAEAEPKPKPEPKPEPSPVVVVEEPKQSCGCGSNFKYDRTRHEQTDRHKRWLKKQKKLA